MNRHDLLNLISRAAVMLQQRGAAGNPEGWNLLTEMSEAVREGISEGSPALALLTMEARSRARKKKFREFSDAPKWDY